MSKPSRLLTQSQIVAIRVKYATDTSSTYASISREYGVSPEFVGGICRGNYLKDAGGPTHANSRRRYVAAVHQGAPRMPPRTNPDVSSVRITTSFDIPASIATQIFARCQGRALDAAIRILVLEALQAAGESK